MYASMPALSAVHAAVLTDERLAQLKAQARARVAAGADAHPHDTAAVVSALMRGAARGVQRRQQQHQDRQQSPLTAAVLDKIHQDWRQLLHARLRGAQQLLPDVPLAAEPLEDGASAAAADGSPQAGWQTVGSAAAQAARENPVLCDTRLLYGADDLLQALCARVAAADGGSVSLLQTVQAPSRHWLRSFFADLQQHQQQAQVAQQAGASCCAAACRAAARNGVRASERPWVWATALGLHAAPPGSEHAGDVWWQLPSARDEQLLQLLCGAAARQVLLVDVLTCADVERVAGNSSHLCEAAQAMRAVLLAFSRDACVQHRAVVPPTPRLAAAAGDGQQTYPPSGVLPFEGMAGFVAPVCCLYANPAAAYVVFRELYCQHFCRLHTPNACALPSTGLAVLCRTFTQLLQEVDAEVHVQLGRLSSSPLELVLPWLCSAFATHLTTSETLLLWDLVIGYDSLLPLAVLAAAIMTSRRELVLGAASVEELAELLADLSQARVVPLLQAVLFGGAKQQP